jgi:hypothetical protein
MRLLPEKVNPGCTPIHHADGQKAAFILACAKPQLPFG